MCTYKYIYLDPRQGRKFGPFCLFASFQFFGSFCLVLSFSAASWSFLPRSHFNFFSCCMYRCKDFCIVRVEHKSGWQDRLSRDTRPMWSSSCQHPKPKRKETWWIKIREMVLGDMHSMAIKKESNRQDWELCQLLVRHKSSKISQCGRQGGTSVWAYRGAIASYMPALHISRMLPCVAMQNFKMTQFFCFVKGCLEESFDS